MSSMSCHSPMSESLLLPRSKPGRRWWRLPRLSQEPNTLSRTPLCPFLRPPAMGADVGLLGKDFCGRGRPPQGPAGGAGRAAARAWLGPVSARRVPAGRHPQVQQSRGIVSEPQALGDGSAMAAEMARESREARALATTAAGSAALGARGGLLPPYRPFTTPPEKLPSHGAPESGPRYPTYTPSTPWHISWEAARFLEGRGLLWPVARLSPPTHPPHRLVHCPAQPTHPPTPASCGPVSGSPLAAPAWGPPARLRSSTSPFRAGPSSAPAYTEH